MRSIVQIQFLETHPTRIDDEVRAVVTEVLTEARRDVVAALPGLTDPFVVTVRYDLRVNATTGEMGRLVTDSWLDWAVDPDRETSALDIARARLRPSFVHESHHALRARLVPDAKPNPVGLESPVDRSLLVPARTDWLIQIAVEEGLATRFENDLCPDAPSLGWQAYEGTPVAAWTEELVAAGRGSYLDWFFELPDGRQHLGYRVGAYVVDEAVRNSGRSAAELVGVPVVDILELAGIAVPPGSLPERQTRRRTTE
jgi:hypothetical protein